MICNKKRKPVFIKWKWNHVVFSRATILSFHPVFSCKGIRPVHCKKSCFFFFLFCFVTPWFSFYLFIKKQKQKFMADINIYSIYFYFLKGSTQKEKVGCLLASPECDWFSSPWSCTDLFHPRCYRQMVSSFTFISCPPFFSFNNSVA